MSEPRGRWYYRWKRYTALVAIIVFVLLTCFTSFHQHRASVRTERATPINAGVAVTLADVIPADSPEHCLLCFWNSTTIAGLLSGRPHFITPLAIGTLLPAGRLISCCLLSIGCQFRAPPFFLA